MTVFKKFIKILVRWIAPAGIVDLARKLRKFHPGRSTLCRPNIRFKGAHKGQRCFVLCNGPSVNRQDLLLLKDEIVFSVSSGYHHKDYLTIQPKYHCVPRISYTEYLHTEDAVAWFKEMHSKIGTAELFLEVAEGPLVRKNKLFSGRRINYIFSGFYKKVSDRKIMDISKMVTEIGTAPVLCMMIAMYMGFKDIYLLGVDNDYCKTGEYKYFFEQISPKGADDFVSPDGKLKGPIYRRFLIFGEVLRQYWILHKIARANNVSIFNATDGGALEEFPRVKFESLFSKQNGAWDIK